MHFYRAYVELTNVCGLACSFCPPKKLPSRTMPLPFFASILKQLKSYTKEIACHVVGDPLTLGNLGAYLDLCLLHGFKALITTSGYYLPKTAPETLFHPAIKQVNISLNSYNKNALPVTFKAYIEPILAFCRTKIERDTETFVNLRLWNLDESFSERGFNEEVFAILSEFFGVTLDAEAIAAKRPKSIRLAPRTLLHFDSYFEWPSLDSSHRSEGFCHGLSSQIAILADGTVVPCCLDKDGIIALGNLKDIPLDEILTSPRVRAIREGFRQKKAVEELCWVCSYKERFAKR